MVRALLEIEADVGLLAGQEVLQLRLAELTRGYRAEKGEAERRVLVVRVQQAERPPGAKALKRKSCFVSEFL